MAHASFARFVGRKLLSIAWPPQATIGALRAVGVAQCTINSSTMHSTSFLLQKKTATVVFQYMDGTRTSVEGKIGDSLLDIVLDNDVDIDGFGACEGTLACSTCHVVLPQDVYDRLEPPCDEEMDMLDLAFELTDTSRLGCQIILTKELDGLVVEVPEGLSDARG